MMALSRYKRVENFTEMQKMQLKWPKQDIWPFYECCLMSRYVKFQSNVFSCHAAINSLLYFILQMLQREE